MSEDQTKRGTPRALKKVNPEKLRTRQIVHELEAEGFRISNSSYGSKNIYYLVKFAPELLERVLTAMRVSSDAGAMWNDIISNEMGHRFSNGDRSDRNKVYEQWLVMVPITLKLLELRPDSTPSRARSITLWSHQLLEQTYPNNKCDDWNLYAARIIFFQIASSAGQRMEESERSEIVSFIYGNLAEVIRVLPALVKRRAYDPELMSVLMNVDAPVLMDGAL